MRATYTFDAYYRLNRDHFLLDRNDPQFYHNDHLTRVSGADVSGRFSTRAGITTSGVHYRSEQIRSTSLGEPYHPGEEIPFNDTITFTHGHQRDQFNVNLNHTYEQNRLTMAGGFMIHMNSDLDFKPRIFPGLDFRWRFPAAYWLYVSINRSMRLPTFTDLYYQGPANVGNPHLSPETATLLEIGGYKVTRRLRIGVNGFYRQGKDLIDWIWMEDEKWHTMNLTRVDAWGGDLRLKYHRSISPHAFVGIETGEFSYTFTHLTKVSEQVNSRYILDNLRHKVVLSTRLRVAQVFYLSVKATGQDRNGTYLAYDTETELSTEQPYDPFLLLDVKLSYAIGRFRLFLETTNLLDATYNDIGNVIQPGRWIQAGFEIR
jgi:iron complex outermembrane receptor protein